MSDTSWKLNHFQKMREIERFIMNKDNHKDSNCLMVTIICHGNDKGHLLDKDKHKAWDTELFVGHLSDVESLVGKPKIMIVQSCVGSEYFNFECYLYNPFQM